MKTGSFMGRVYGQGQKKRDTFNKLLSPAVLVVVICEINTFSDSIR